MQDAACMHCMCTSHRELLCCHQAKRPKRSALVSGQWGGERSGARALKRCVCYMLHNVYDECTLTLRWSFSAASGEAFPSRKWCQALQSGSGRSQNPRGGTATRATTDLSARQRHNSRVRDTSSVIALLPSPVGNLANMLPPPRMRRSPGG